MTVPLFVVCGASLVSPADALLPGIGGTMALSTYCMMVLTAFMAWIRSVLKKAGKGVKTLPGAQPTLRLLGVDKFSTFELKVIVHEIKDTVGSIGASQIRITHSHKTRQTSVQKGGKWEETLKITVKQGVPTAKVELFCKTTLGRMKMFGAAKLDINKSIIQMGFPKRFELQLMRDKRRVGDVVFSFAPANSLEGDAAKVAKADNDKKKSVHNHIVAQTQQRILANAATGLNSGRSSTLPVSYGANSDFVAERMSSACETSSCESNSPDQETHRRVRALTALGQVCSGPVEVGSLLGLRGSRKMFVENEGDEWFLSWQRDEDVASKKRVNWDSILAIKATEKKNEFSIIYSDRVEQTMTVKAVDRDGEHWTHGLHLFKKEYAALKTHESMVRKAKRKAARRAGSVLSDRSDDLRTGSSIGGSGAIGTLGMPAGSQAARVMAGLQVPTSESESDPESSRYTASRPSGRLVNSSEARDRGQGREKSRDRSREPKSSRSKMRASENAGKGGSSSRSARRSLSANSDPSRPSPSSSVPPLGRLSGMFSRSRTSEQLPKMSASLLAAPSKGVKSMRSLSQGVRASVMIAGSDMKSKAKDAKADLKDSRSKRESRRVGEVEQNPGSQAALSMV